MPRNHAACASVNVMMLRVLILLLQMVLNYLGLMNFVFWVHTFLKLIALNVLFTNVKSLFFRSANAIFGKVGRIASENVVIHLIYSKCLPVLLYGLECFMLSKSQLNSLDFSFNRFLFKLFKTADINVVNFCRDMFNVKLPSELLALRRKRFTLKYNEYRGINRVNLA